MIQLLNAGISVSISVLEGRLFWFPIFELHIRHPWWSSHCSDEAQTFLHPHITTKNCINQDKAAKCSNAFSKIFVWTFSWLPVELPVTFWRKIDDPIGSNNRDPRSEKLQVIGRLPQRWWNNSGVSKGIISLKDFSGLVVSTTGFLGGSGPGGLDSCDPLMKGIVT